MKDQKLLLKNCKMINSNLVDPIDIFIKNGFIERIGKDGGFEDFENKDLRIINANCSFVLPGLIDCHVHLILNGNLDLIEYVKENDKNKYEKSAEKNSQRSLNNGITSLRDMGCYNFIVPQLRDRINKGKIIGPTILSSGHMISKKKGHVKNIARETDCTDTDLNKAIMEQIKGGSDFIKIIVSGGILTPDLKPYDTEMKKKCSDYLIKKVLKKNLKSAVHVYGDRDIKNAVDAGIWSVEHGSWASQHTMKLIAKKAVFFVPTLKASFKIIENKDQFPSYMLKNAEKVYDAACKSIKRADTENVIMAMGTDAGTPNNFHGENAFELVLMSELGVSNHKLVDIATINGSRLLGKSNIIGKIEPGFIADIVVINKNPLDNIKALVNNVKLVVKRGEIIRNEF